MFITPPLLQKILQQRGLRSSVVLLCRKQTISNRTALYLKVKKRIIDSLEYNIFKVQSKVLLLNFNNNWRIL